MNENKLREQICTLASSMFDRGITHGSTGNISVRLDNDDILVTPSGSSFGRLEPNEIVKVTKSGQFIGSLSPTKELPLHKAFYETRGMKSGAVVHLHSTHSVALSMLPGIDEDNVLPSYTETLDLARLTMLVYEYGKSFEIDGNQTIEKFLTESIENKIDIIEDLDQFFLQHLTPLNEKH